MEDKAERKKRGKCVIGATTSSKRKNQSLRRTRHKAAKA